jgi:hypothetical protein
LSRSPRFLHSSPLTASPSSDAMSISPAYSPREPAPSGLSRSSRQQERVMSSSSAEACSLLSFPLAGSLYSQRTAFTLVEDVQQRKVVVGMHTRSKSC